ncbi:hypothetical protein BH09BAC3_BH09BAC3_12900 [soil metagenome]
MISKEYKGVVVFLAKFLGLYLILNLAYGFFIEYYEPDSDPATRLITSHVVWLLSFVDSSVSSNETPGVYYITVQHSLKTVIRVFEGCNSLNVMIVYVSFLFAFTGPLKLVLRYLLFGIAVIYVMNLARVIVLYGVALYYPKNLYFFHKYFFTGILYAVVFVLWYIWIRKITKLESGNSTAESQS